MSQSTIGGTPLQAKPAGDIWDSWDGPSGEPKCGRTIDGDQCRRYAVIGVKLDAVPGDGWFPVCDRHAKGAWLYAAGVANGD